MQFFEIEDTKNGTRSQIAFQYKSRAKEERNKLNDKHKGWPVYGKNDKIPKGKKVGSRIDDRMPRFIIVPGPDHGNFSELM